jgi:hypothetical protein
MRRPAGARNAIFCREVGSISRTGPFNIIGFVKLTKWMVTESFCFQTATSKMPHQGIWQELRRRQHRLVTRRIGADDDRGVCTSGSPTRLASMARRRHADDWCSPKAQSQRSGRSDPSTASARLRSPCRQSLGALSSSANCAALAPRREGQHSSQPAR